MVPKEQITKTERALITIESDEMLRGLYRFNGIWDMEPCPVVVENKRIRWNIRFQGDPEWTYTFTRMDYLYKLIIATEISGNNKYVRHGLKIINKWFQGNWVYLGSLRGWILRTIIRKDNLGHRTLDVAMMLSNMVDYLLYCVEHGHVRQYEFARYQRKLEKVIRYVVSHSDEGNKAHINWGIIENGCVVYSLLRLKSRKYYAEVCSRLVRQVHNQISSEGSQIESSPMYLVEILLCLLRIINLPNCDIREDLTKPVIQGCSYIMSIRKLDNCIPNLGDSDITDISDLMLIASHVLGHDVFLDAVSRPLDLEYAFKFSMSRTVPETHNTQEKELVSYRYQTVYRSFTDGVYLLCSNTPRLVDGHKHYDYLSVLYSEFGKDVLVDLGRFSYKNDESRRSTKGPEGHNTIHISGSPHYEYINSWATREQIECFDNIVMWDKGTRVTMRCILGYMEQEICRDVIYHPDKELEIRDSVVNHTDKKCCYETYFNIGPDFSITQEGNTILLRDDSGHCISYHNNSHHPVEIRQVYYSTQYNTRQTISQIVLKSDGCVTHFFTKIVS